MTSVPNQIVRSRRVAGVILMLSALGTVIILLLLTAQCSAQSSPVVGVPRTSLGASTATVSVLEIPHR